MRCERCRGWYICQADLPDPTHLSLGIGLQPEQTAHLQGLRLDDASPHEVFRVGVHVVQESRAKPQELRRNREGWQTCQLPDNGTPVPKTHFSEGRTRGSETQSTHCAPHLGAGARQGWGVRAGALSCLAPPLTLALVTSGSMGWLALKIFCASCWGLRQERVDGVRDPATLA